MQADDSFLDRLGNIFWLVIAITLVVAIPAIVAYWIASRVHPLPEGPFSVDTHWPAIERRADLAAWLTVALLVILVLITNLME